MVSKAIAAGNRADVQDSKVLCLLGPTGTGKTELAIRLARRFPLGLVSVDSALVYRGLNIGTAKPEPDILRRWPHHLVNIKDPSERYSAGEFRRDALAAIDQIKAAGLQPLLVGGTFLYFRALTEGLAELPEPDQALRARLDSEAARQGWPAMHQRLRTIDEASARRINPNDAQRIQRALEVFEQTGKPLSDFQRAAMPAGAGFHQYLKIGLIPSDRKNLNQNLEKRFNHMIEKGLLDEVRALFARKELRAELPAIRAVGYRQLWQHLEGQFDLEEACRRAVVATRRLAKRQMTWLRGEPLHASFDPFAADLDTQVIDFLEPNLCRRQGAL